MDYHVIPSPEYNQYLEDLRVSSPKSPELSNAENILRYNCPICSVSLESDNCMSTMVGYYSEPGHDHDNNCRKFYFDCGCGCKFKVRVQNTCPTCDWKGKEVCGSCGPNLKL